MAASILMDKTRICTSNEELPFKNVPTLVAKDTNENFKSLQYYFIKINLNNTRFWTRTDNLIFFFCFQRYDI